MVHYHILLTEMVTDVIIDEIITNEEFKQINNLMTEYETHISSSTALPLPSIKET